MKGAGLGRGIAITEIVVSGVRGIGRPVKAV